MSLRRSLWADRTSSGRTRLPRFSRIAVGKSSLISLEKDINLELGSREVVTSTLGSNRSQWLSYDFLDTASKRHTYDTRQLRVFVVDIERVILGKVPGDIVAVVLP